MEEGGGRGGGGICNSLGTLGEEDERRWRAIIPDEGVLDLYQLQ